MDTEPATMRRAIIIAILVNAMAVMGPAATAIQARSTPMQPDLFSRLKTIKARSLATDFQCLNDCTQAGHMYAFCKEKCSYPDPGLQYVPPANNEGGVPRTDFKCLS